jgi:transposase
MLGSWASGISSEDSSGGKRWLGQITKQGSSLSRFLVVEAA